VWISPVCVAQLVESPYRTPSARLRQRLRGAGRRHSLPFDAAEQAPSRAEDEYARAKATLPARCGTARLMLQIDMGIGDSVWPAPHACAYPTLLDFPADVVSRKRR
jgi:hypothetical protein